MKSDFIVALTQLAAERNLPREIVLSAIEAALVSAYRKDSVTAGQDLSVKLDPATGDVNVHVLKTVVEEVSDPHIEISLADARKIKPDAEIEESIATETLPHSAGRIAAQTAKQVVMQRLREAERELIMEEFADREGEVFSVNIQRVEPRQVIVDLGRAEAILPVSEQAPTERYRAGLKMKVLLQSVERSAKGPEFIVSRADKLLLKRLFEMEVPEVFNGVVEIVAIAREAGSRSKVAVRARQDGVDPVGSCVGLRGVRIQNIVSELQGEKIDVVAWSKDPNRFIANALSPSQVLHVELDEETESAVAVVPDRQLSLAIGREGQNARLAARLTGWNVDIRSNVDSEAATAERKKAASTAGTGELKLIEDLALATRSLNALKTAGITTVAEIVGMAKPDLLGIEGFGPKSYTELHDKLESLGLLAVEATAVVETAEAVAEEVVEAVAEVATEAVAAPEAVVDETVVAEAVVDAEVVEEAVEEAAEAPVAEVDVVEVQPDVEETPSEAAAPVEVAVPADAVQAEATPEAAFAAEVVELETQPPEEVSVEKSASISDLPENVWSFRRPGGKTEPGQIRFAEDIAGLRGGVTARRDRQGSGGGGRKRRRSGPARRRR
jgi:N utilization substance protein A